MDAVLLDTDVFSFFFKRDTRRELYAPHIRERQLCLSFMSVAEIKKWAIERNWGERRLEQLVQVLKHYVVLPYDAPMADAWAEIAVVRRRLGREISCGDCWIAAAAVRHEIPLCTHNLRDFRDVPRLTVLSHADES